ncbi:uncharacterized protein MELLADRAFT_108389 [Melampsora larici-populina 98AG31]|uniref:Uncharacterized protein n=1 Tax=Melampsora larici-populina (strain 98AG31 / pathotype 3-4-7) TaxID=747676 RepID=F4RSY3_MELLP|nr:uncharacterized protein MELLADRAFT_108389 [Melampsora larici-populina 98AG31]EGG04409.1 hypothetical protein MELLADRAFT_108389 [Melampsora larici-populina 98AG31]
MSLHSMIGLSFEECVVTQMLPFMAYVVLSRKFVFTSSALPITIFVLRTFLDVSVKRLLQMGHAAISDSSHAECFTCPIEQGLVIDLMRTPPIPTRSQLRARLGFPTGIRGQVILVGATIQYPHPLAPMMSMRRCGSGKPCSQRHQKGEPLPLWKTNTQFSDSSLVRVIEAIGNMPHEASAIYMVMQQCAPLDAVMDAKQLQSSMY